MCRCCYRLVGAGIDCVCLYRMCRCWYRLCRCLYQLCRSRYRTCRCCYRLVGAGIDCVYIGTECVGVVTECVGAGTEYEVWFKDLLYCSLMCAICWLEYGKYERNFAAHRHQQTISFLRPVCFPLYFSSCSPVHLFISSPVFVHNKRTQVQQHSRQRAAAVFIHVPILCNFKYILRPSSPDTNS